MTIRTDIREEILKRLRRVEIEHGVRVIYACKKYFYALRPLLAIQYIEERRGIPPVAFEDLAAAVAPRQLRGAIEDLLTLKRATPELGLGDPVPVIGKFIEEELERHGTLFSGQGRPDLAAVAAVRHELNDIFRGAVREDAQSAANHPG